jgi:hypothetical protein
MLGILATSSSYKAARVRAEKYNNTGGIKKQEFFAKKMEKQGSTRCGIQLGTRQLKVVQPTGVIRIRQLFHVKHRKTFPLMNVENVRTYAIIKSIFIGLFQPAGG